MSAAYWPWWLSAASLAVVTVGCCIVARRPLGVSGIVARFVNLRAELEAERQRRAVSAADDAALEAALLAATAEAFAEQAIPAAACAAAPELVAIGATDAPRAGDAPAARPREHAAHKGCDHCAAAESRPTLGVHAFFLVAIVLGGLATQLARGAWTARLDLGPEFRALFGAGAASWLTLALGGVLVGIGTTLSGGCSTGHGLSGCSRLQPAGVAATASFVGAAVAVSLLLQRSFS